MDITLQEDIKFYVLNGKFEEIKNIMSNIDFMEFEEVYISCAHEQENIMFYTCILDMMKDNETAELHDLAFLLLVYPLSEVEGVLEAAYYHADASIQLTNGKEIKSLLQMLLLYAIPDPIISDSEAFKVAKQILKLDPNNHVARNVLKDSAKRMDNVIVNFDELKKFGSSK